MLTVYIIFFRWLNGSCNFGPRCNFAHGDRELRPGPVRETPSDAKPRVDRSIPSKGKPNRAAPSQRSEAEQQAWIASGRPVEGPGGWTQYTTDKGEKYYHNQTTDVTQWEAPPSWK